VVNGDITGLIMVILNDIFCGSGTASPRLTWKGAVKRVCYLSSVIASKALLLVGCVCNFVIMFVTCLSAALNVKVKVKVWTLAIASLT